MHRILPTGLLFLATAAAAQAQQADTLVSHVADSTAAPLASELRISDPLQPTAAAVPNLPGLTNIQSVLSRVAGVQVTPYSGAPGAWAAVRIRGVSNVTGYSQPLYVVDGVPVYNSDVAPERWFGVGTTSSSVTPFAPGSNPLMDLPVDDVASVEVLQDASATARYGLQGSNGVVRITTRQGADGLARPQPLRVRYAGYVGVQQVRQRYHLLDGPQFAALANLAAANDGLSTQPYTAQEVSRRGSVDWQDELFRTALLTGHNLSLDGNTRTTRYYVAADYLNQNGVLKGSSLARYNLRANVDQQLGSKLSLGLRVAGSQIDQRQPGYEPNAGPLVQRALQSPPLGTEYDAQGLPLTSDPAIALRELQRAPRTRRLLTQVSATYQPLPGLVLSVRGSREQVNVRDVVSSDFQVYSGSPFGRSVRSEEATTRSTSWVGVANLRYQHTIAERHTITASAEYLLQDFSLKSTDSVRTTTFFAPGSPIGNGSAFSYATASFEQKLQRPIHSPSLAVGYVYDGRYEVQASLRADRLRNYTGDRDTALLYPGAQVRWHLGHEAFLDGVAGLDDLVLQAGMGRTSGSIFSLQQLGFRGVNIDLTTQFDAGVQTAWLGHRLTAAATLYQRRTQHVMGTLSTPVPMGGTFFYNADFELRNRGLEITLGGNWQAGSLQGSTGLAMASAINQVMEIANYNPFTGKLTTVPSLSGTTLETGKSVSQYQVVDGRLSSNGSLQTNNLPAELYGTGLPRYTLNFTQQLRYRRWQLDAQVDGLFGYQIQNPTLQTLDVPTGRTNVTTDALNYWTPSNQNTTIPRPSRFINSQFSTRQNLANGDHLRLTQLVLNYDLLNAGSRKVSVWVGGQNLFITGSYRGYDPNVNSRGAAPLTAGIDAATYPVARVWQVGVRGQF